VNEAGLADINSVPENASLETIKRPNKIMKLMNNEGSSRKPTNRNNSWKTKSASKVVGNMMDFQLPPLKNLSTSDTDTLPGFSNVVSEHMSRFSPIDTSKICIRKRKSGPVLSLDIHHGDLVIMNGKVLQDNYDQ
jgi:hypothetical protein